MQVETASAIQLGPGCEFAPDQHDGDGRSGPTAPGQALSIGLIDANRFGQECLSAALARLQPLLTVHGFGALKDCIGHAGARMDLILYYSHAASCADPACICDIEAVCRAFPATPVIVLSDADDAMQPRTIGAILRTGAHGVVPTRTTGLPMTAAAIRFVQAGGTFAPIEALLNRGAASAQPAPGRPAGHNFTPRQMSVLFHLQRGNPNKIIAHELGMSESTVKVHVRNIMRRMNATNRTQAVYKARQLWAGEA